MNRWLPVGILLLALAIGTWLLWPSAEPPAPANLAPTPPAAADGAAPAPAAHVEPPAAKTATTEATAERTAAPAVRRVEHRRQRCGVALPLVGTEASIEGVQVYVSGAIDQAAV